MLTKGMAIDWGQHGIQVNGLGPGYFKTELTEALVEQRRVHALADRPHALAPLGRCRGPGRRGGVPGERRLQLRQRPHPLRRWRRDRHALNTEQHIMEALVIHAPGDLRVEEHRHARARRPASCACACAAAASAAPTCTTTSTAASAPCASRSRWCWATRWPASSKRSAPASRASRSGERIAISPSRPCGLCRYCQQGLQNHCLDMRYYGSAMRTPHVQGAFRQQIVVEHAPGAPAGRHAQRRRRRDGRAAVGGAARGAPRRPAAGQARAGHRLRADRRAGDHRGAARRRRATSWPPTSARYPLRKALKVGADEVDQRRRGARGAWPRFTRRQGQLRRAVRSQRQRARAASAPSTRCARAASSCRSGWAAR